MLEALTDLIASFGSKIAVASADADGERLAIAALLVHVATVDGIVLDSETEALERMLAERFALGRPAARQLIGAAAKADGEAADFSDFTANLKRRLGPEERRQVIAMMWDIARADGQVHEFEESLIARVAQLLEVGAGDGGN